MGGGEWAAVVLAAITICSTFRRDCCSLCYPFLKPPPPFPQVLSLNGTRIHNLRHLAELVMSCTDQYLRFDCEYMEAVVLDREAAFRDTAAVSDLL